NFLVGRGDARQLQCFPAKMAVRNEAERQIHERRSCMGNPLFARKPMSLLLEECKDEGGHSLKRTLGPFQLTALGVGAIIGAGMVSSGWSNHFIELLKILHLRMPLWLAYDHWTGLATATKMIAREMARASDPSLLPGTQAFLDKVDAIMAARSPELVQRAQDLLGAPKLFGAEVGFNLPAFVIALIITAILVIGIKESARFNATIVTIKVAVVLFVIALGSRYVDPSNWGHDWSRFAPMGFSGIGAGAAYIFFAYIGFDAVSTTAQECNKPQ